MRRIDDPSAAATLPVPEAAGTEGFFTEGSPGVTPATLVRASFLNMVQEELRSIVVAGGLTPSKTAYNQVVLAIQALVQQSAGGYALDTGTANVCQVAYAPAVTAVNDGMVLKFRAKFANTGAATFAPNGLAAAPIWGGDHAAIGGGEIVANGDVWVQWNSALNGTGAWMLIDSTGGFLRSPTPAQFDSTTKLATMAAVQRALGNRAGEVAYSSNGSMNLSDVGKTIVLSSITAFTLTLPSYASVPLGSELFFVNSNAGAVTLNRSGADVIATGGTAYTSIVIPPNGSLRMLTSNGAWANSTGDAGLALSPLFASSLAASGYQKLPSGLILQWTSAVINGSGAITFPISFPNAAISAFAVSANGAVPFYYGIGAPGLSSVAVNANTAGAAIVNLLVIGR